MVKYYDIRDDINEFDAWCYIIFGGRAVGKTYGTLKMVYEDNTRFLFLKRTIDDVNLICSGGKNKKFKIDLSPFKSINRDMNINVRAFSIGEGLGAFYNCNVDNEPVGEPVGYIMALSAISKFKGFDLSDCDVMIFDEFVPKIYDRFRRAEGEQLLDLYRTVSRDREHRGRKALKLICLSNADNIASPVTNILEITDTLVDMQLNNTEYTYDRGIFVRSIKMNDEFMQTERNSSIYKTMEGTEWAQMSYDNNFAYNDLSNVGKINLKNYKCICAFIFNRKMWYVYKHNTRGDFFITNTRGQYKKIYDLSKESHQKSFFVNVVFRIRVYMECDSVTFSHYSIYELFRDYTKYFRL